MIKCIPTHSGGGEISITFLSADGSKARTVWQSVLGITLQ